MAGGRRWNEGDVENMAPGVAEQVREELDKPHSLDLDLFDTGAKPDIRRLEQELQISIVSYADLSPFPEFVWRCQRWLAPPVKIGHYLHHTPNGGGRSKAEGGIFKAMGVRAGYPDLSLDICVIDNEDVYPGWRCEIKVGKEKPRPNQTLELEKLERAGYVCTVARSLNQWQAQLEDYLGLGKPLYRGIR